MIRKDSLVVLGLAVMLATGCGAVKIRQIAANPGKYNNRDVRVEGTVTRSAGIPIAGYYSVRDDTGTIHVLANGPVPPRGSEVRVKGRVTSGVTVMGRGFGTLLHERDHKLR